MTLIRTSRPSEMDQLAELCREHARFDREGGSGIGPLPDDLARRLEWMIFQERKLVCFVATHDDSDDAELLGFASSFRQPSTWRGDEYFVLDCLFVREDHRGEGIGQRLFEATVMMAEGNEIDRLQWQTPAWNSDAHRFYDAYRAGYEEKRRYNLPLTPLEL